MCTVYTSKIFSKKFSWNYSYKHYLLRYFSIFCPICTGQRVGRFFSWSFNEILARCSSELTQAAHLFGRKIHPVDEKCYTYVPKISSTYSFCVYTSFSRNYNKSKGAKTCQFQRNYILFSTWCRKTRAKSLVFLLHPCKIITFYVTRKVDL